VASRDVPERVPAAFRVDGSRRTRVPNQLARAAVSPSRREPLLPLLRRIGSATGRYQSPERDQQRTGHRRATDDLYDAGDGFSISSCSGCHIAEYDRTDAELEHEYEH
jgi:hypothetical protein